MFISKECLKAVSENLRLLNREVKEIKKYLCISPYSTEFRDGGEPEPKYRIPMPVSKEGVVAGECCEMCKAMEIFKGLKWKEEMALDFDRETNTILVDEDLLMHYIQLANPSQPKRKLCLYSKRVME